MHVDNCSVTVSRTPIQRWMWGALAFGVAAIVTLAVAFAPFPAAAGLKETVAEFMSTVLSAIVSVVGKLLLLAIYILTLIAQYNDFVNAAAVKNGWVIVRDVGNMFFIVVLLIIAFATILNVSSYQWKAMLPQLVIAAILINFSKTIAGIFIDLSQVMMLTFVNGFAAAAGGNFANMYRIQDLLSLDPNGSESTGLSLLAILGSYILAFILLTIALVTTLIMAVIMAFRIVMLWALVVLSPLPYVLNLLPQGKKYGGRWWSMFGEYLTVGPVLAFFLWLALVSVGSGNVGETFTGSGGAGTSGSEIAATRGATGALPTSAADPRSLISFVIGICMLIAGLKITGEMGVIGASAASGAVNKFGSIAKGAAKKFTGYRYASERVGGAWAMRESARKERAQAGAAKLYGAYGTALAAPGRGIDAIKNKIPQRLRDKIPSLQSKAQDLQREAAAARAVGDLKTAKSKERQARWVNRTSTAVGIGWKAGMVGLAPVTGGASLLGLAPAAIRQMQKGGAAAESAGRDYKYKEVSKALDAMKDTKPNDVQKQIDDQSKPGTERMAAFLKATQDGLLDPKMVEGGEDFLQSLGADKKTISTFKSYAEKGHYAGTMLKGDRPDRQKRIREGRMPTKDLNAKEFEGDKGSLAADFVVHGNDAQRKELGNSKALKEAYKKGVQDAAGTAKDPDDKQKLQAELMRLGGDKATGQTAFQISGMDAAALGKALQSSQSSDILANIDEKDLAIDPATGTSAVLDAIVKNVNPARLNAAIGSAKKPDADPQASVNMAALQDAIKNSKGAKNYEAARSPVRGAESDVASVQKNLEKQQAVVRRSPAGSPQRTAAYSVVQRLQGDLTAAQNNLTTMQQQFEDQMKNVQKMEKQEQQLYEAMKRSKGK